MSFSGEQVEVPSLRQAQEKLDSIPPPIKGFELDHEPIGKGAGGRVYRAKQKYPQRDVAIKIPSGIPAGSYHEEIRALAKKEHPNIPAVFEVGDTYDGRVYISMELVNGQNLDDYCKLNRSGFRQRVELLLQVCRAVHFVHSQENTESVVHRDIKLNNIMVTEVEGQPVVKLMDFGLCRILDQLLTHEADDRSSNPVPYDQGVGADIYAIGILFWQLVTGKPESRNAHRLDNECPEQTEEKHQRMLALLVNGCSDVKHLTRIQETERSLRRKLDADIRYMLQRVLIQRQDFYESANELATDLACYLDCFPLASRPYSFVEAARKTVRRNDSLSALSIFGLIVCILLYFAWGKINDQTAEEALLNTEVAGLYESLNPEAIEEETFVASNPIELMLEAARRLEPQHDLRDDEFTRGVNLAKSLSGNGKYDEAASVWRKLYTGVVSDFGESSIAVMPFRLSLACALLKAGAAQEAQELSVENNYWADKHQLEDDDPLVLAAALYIAGAQEFGGHLDVANEIRREFLKRNGGVRTALWADCHNSMATTYIKMQQFKRALEASKYAIAFYEDEELHDHPNAHVARANRAIALERLGRSVDAIATARATVASFERIYLSGALPLDRQRFNLAMVLGRNGYASEALGLLADIGENQQDKGLSLRSLVEAAGIRILKTGQVTEGKAELQILLPTIVLELGEKSAAAMLARGYLSEARERQNLSQ